MNVGRMINPRELRGSHFEKRNKPLTKKITYLQGFSLSY